MCGISGIVYFEDIKITRELISNFNNELTHRGPDSADIYIDEVLNLGLGHRRLSILDLSDAANQPMSFQNKRYWLVYNGEIFNFIELKTELLTLGYSFDSDSDSEVVLAAYAEWGEDCVKRFNGMWAIAILDRENKKIFLSRDRFGIKPLYYTHNNHLFAFASESIAFKKLKGFKKNIHPNNTLFVINNPYSLEGTGQTIYENLYQLKSGHNAVLDLNTKQLKEYKWWDTLTNSVQIPDKYDDQVALFRELFADATRLRMRSDVPLASALSGGVDSSAVYCMIYHIMKTQGGERIQKDWQRAYNVGFPDSIFDESHFAKEVIDFTKGDGRYLLPNYTNLVDEIVSSTMLFDNIYNIPVYPMLMVYGAMQKDGYKISMDGHGGDEMLFGYQGFIKNAYGNALKAGNLKFANEILDVYLNMFLKNERQHQKELLNQQFHAQEPSLVSRGIKKIGRSLGFFDKKSLPKEGNWLSPYTPVTGPELNLSQLKSSDERDLYLAFHQTILPSILRNFDRGGMQKSIEIRMPLMDWRLVSFAFSLPLESKLGAGFTKRILRDSMKGLMPESIRTRTLKVGMSSPLPTWFGDTLKPLILDELHSSAFRNSNLWDSKKILSFVEYKMDKKSWTYEETVRFWPILNAHLLIKNLNE